MSSAVLVREAGVRYGPTSDALHIARTGGGPDRGRACAAIAAEPIGLEADRNPGADQTADLVEDLGDEIATLSAHIHAATHRLLTLIAQFDRLRGWELAGHSNCARWLAARTGIDLGAAREKVRAARALEDLPLTSAAMARGELSFSQVRAMTRVAQAETESELLELARGTTTAQLERMVRAWKLGSRQDEAERERERHASRTLSVFPDDDGMYVVRGRLTPEVGALLMRALEAAGDALFRDRSVASASSAPHRPPTGRDASVRVAAKVSADPERDAAQRRADAIGLLAERALAAGLAEAGSGAQPPTTRSGGAESGGAESVGAESNGAEFYGASHGNASSGGTSSSDASPPDASSSAAASSAAASSTAPVSGTRAQRYQVVLHVDAATLQSDSEPGRSELEDGTRVSAETSRRLSCDASVVLVRHAHDGAVLDVGRRTRTISPALRRALEVRDRGCRFPGCGLRFTDAHHVEHWADGGPTSLANCLLLCGWHHRLVHEGGWRVEWWGAGRPVFFDPRGSAHFDGGWKPPALAEEPVESLIAMNERLGIRPGPSTLGTRWQRETDIPDHVYFRAMEAV